jgi:hypothetical protein
MVETMEKSWFEMVQLHQNKQYGLRCFNHMNKQTKMLFFEGLKTTHGDRPSQMFGIKHQR